MWPLFCIPNRHISTENAEKLIFFSYVYHMDINFTRNRTLKHATFIVEKYNADNILLTTQLIFHVDEHRGTDSILRYRLVDIGTPIIKIRRSHESYLYNLYWDMAQILVNSFRSGYELNAYLSIHGFGSKGLNYIPYTHYRDVIMRETASQITNTFYISYETVFLS